MSIDYSDLLHCSLKDASVRIKKYSEKDMDAIEEFIKTKDPNTAVHYTHLLVYRRDSLRLLNFICNQSVMVCEACCRFLKIGSVRKDLLRQLSTEEKFLSTFNNSCELVKQTLIELLVWKKEHPANCLADRLYKNPSLQLTPALRLMLRQALSLELCLEEDISNTRYCKRHHKELEVLALKKLYKIYTDLKNGEYKDDPEEALDKSGPLLRLIKRPYLKTEIDGQPVYLWNVLIDIWNGVASDDQIRRFIRSLDEYKEYYTYPGTSLNLKQAKFCGNGMKDFLKYYIINSPYFMVKRLNLMKYSNYWTLRFALIIFQACHGFKDEELDSKRVPILVECALRNMNVNYWNNIQNVLSNEEFSLFLDQVMDALMLIEPNEKFSSSTELSFALVYLWKYVPYTNPKLAVLMDVLTQSEKDIVQFRNEFLKFFQQEVPFDFDYNMLPKEMKEMFTTARKFESLVCLKGSSLLNKDDQYQRNNILNSIVEMAVYSRDARCVLRCLNMIASMEAKFTDLSINWGNHRELFSPDSLGLSPLSVQQSGSAEVAKTCRQKIVDLLLDWAQQKKGTLMVNPLLYIILYMYFYASEYPEYEDEYCEMMKPIVGYLVNKKLQWDDMDLPNLFSIDSQRWTTLNRSFCLSARFSHLELPERKRHLIVESFMRGEASHLPKKASFGAHGFIVLNLSMESSMDLFKPMVSKPLSMILSFMNDENSKRSYVAKLFKRVISSSLIARNAETNQTTKQEVPNTDIIFVTTTTHLTYTKDYMVLDNLFWDMTIPYQPCYSGYSALQMLMTLEPSAMSLKDYLNRTNEKTRHEYMHKDKIAKVLSKEMSTLQQLQKVVGKGLIPETPETANIYSPVIEEAAKTFTQSTNFVNSVELSEASLTWIFSAMQQYNLFTILNTTDHQKVIQSLSGLNDSDLLLLASLTALRLQIVFQGAVMVISINQSPNPLFQNQLVEMAKQLHQELLSALTAQVLVNNEIQYRELTPNKTEFTIKTTVPFLHAFLTSIREKTTQTIKEMQDITPAGAEPTILTVALNLYDNTVIGRFVEILVYSRKTKDYFGKSLSGIVPFALMLDYSTIVQIIRRLLLTTTFIPLAEAIVNKCLMSTSPASPFFREMLHVVQNASKSMTVGTILFLLRLAKHPLVRQNNKVFRIVSGTISTVLTRKFDSESVYIMVIEWILNQVVACKTEEIDSFLSMLKMLSSLDTKSSTTSVVFNIVCDIARNLYRKDAITLFEKLRDCISKIVECEDPSRRVAVLGVLEEMILSFDYKQASDISNQCIHLLEIHSSLKSDAFIAKCQELFKEEIDFEYAVNIVIYLFTIQPQTANDLFLAYHSSLTAKLTTPTKDRLNRVVPPTFVPEVNFFRLLRDTSREYSDILLVRFIAQLPSSIFPFQAVTPFASLLLKFIGDTTCDKMEDCSFDVDAFVSELEKTIQPWTYSAVIKFMELFTTSLEMDDKFYDYFLKNKTEASALSVILTCSTVERQNTVLSWIVNNNVTNLYFAVH